MCSEWSAKQYFDGDAFQAETVPKHIVCASLRQLINYTQKIWVGGGGKMGMIRGDRGVAW
jgi:hypothetical protein